MPYIKQENRTKFKSLIEGILPEMKGESDAAAVKCEYFGYFVNRIICNFLNYPADPNSLFNNPNVNNPFNYIAFNLEKRKKLSVAADKISALINKDDCIGSAGELNYVITAVYWGLLTDSTGYGVRAFLTGVLEVIKAGIKTSKDGDPKEKVMSMRKYFIVQGVLSHVLFETYFQKTIPYEKVKYAENGGIWLDGFLNAKD